MVPTFTKNRSTREMPSYIPAASPRVRRSLSSWPPHRLNPAAESPAPCSQRAPTTHRPRSTRFESARRLQDFTRWFLSYTFSSRLPDPRRLAVPTRPLVVRTAPHLPGVSRIRLSSASARLLRQPSGKGLPPLLGHTGASWRTNTLETDGQDHRPPVGATSAASAVPDPPPAPATAKPEHRYSPACLQPCLS
jgi:hypothetical protein